MEASIIYAPCKIHARWGRVSNHHQWEVQNSRPLNPSGNQLEGKCLASPQHHHSYFSKGTASSFHNSFETNKLTPNWKQWNSILACYSQSMGRPGVYFAKFQTKKYKKNTGKNPSTSISVLILCNYLCIERHTKKRRKIRFLFLSIWQSSRVLLGSKCASEPPGELDRNADPWHPHSLPTVDRVCISVYTGPGDLYFKQTERLLMGAGILNHRNRRERTYRKH